MTRNDQKRCTRLTPNQIVAFNVTELRQEKGWTQERTADELELYLGKRWSKATFSSVERSIDGKRVKSFDADELSALALTFDVAVSRLFVPPTQFVRGLPVQIAMPDYLPGYGFDPGTYTVAMVRRTGLADNRDTANVAPVVWAKLLEILYRRGKKLPTGQTILAGTRAKQDAMQDLERFQRTEGMVPNQQPIDKSMAAIRRSAKLAKGAASKTRSNGGRQSAAGGSSAGSNGKARSSR